MNSFKEAEVTETTQDLSAGSLTLSLAPTQRDVFIQMVGMFFDGAVSQTVQLKLLSPTGASYLYLIDSSVLTSSTDYVYHPNKALLVPSGWTATLTCTNTSTPAVNAFASIVYQER